MHRRLKLVILIILPVLLLSACSFRFPWEKERSGFETPTIESNREIKLSEQDLQFSWTNNLRKFKSLETVKEFLKESSVNRGVLIGDLNVDANFGLGHDISRQSEIDWESNAISEGTLSRPELIKVDNNQAYLLVKNNLKIINLTSEGEEAELASLEFNTRPFNLLISNKHLLVFRPADQKDLALNSDPQTSYTAVDFFNISYPNEPQKERTLVFDGNLLELRANKSFLYLVGIKVATLIDEELDLPSVFQNGENLNLDSEFYYFDSPYKNYSFLSVFSVDIDRPQSQVALKSYLVDANYKYSFQSSGNFYLLRTDLLSLADLEQEFKRELVFSKLNTSSQQRIKELKNNLEKSLRSGELQIKVAAIVDSYLQNLSSTEQSELEEQIKNGLENRIKQKAKEIDKTTIYKFRVDAGKFNYLAKQDLAGQVIANGSLEEDANFIYLNTNRSSIWSKLFTNPDKMYSNFYVLNNKLEIVGNLDNIASDSSVDQVFYLKNKAYLRLKSIDEPMYLIDLANKSKPSLLGGIKIPNYPYLYPFDNSGLKFFALSLAGANKDVAMENENLELNGSALKISLYNLSDIKDPREIGVYNITGNIRNSLALDDYLSLTNSLRDARLVIPMALRADNSNSAFSGAVVLGIEEDSLKVMGQIDHSDGGHSSLSDFWQNYYYTDDMVKRTFLKDQLIYTLSNKYLKLSNINNLSTVRSFRLLDSEESYVDESDKLNDEIDDIPPLEAGIYLEDNANIDSSIIIEDKIDEPDSDFIEFIEDLLEGEDEEELL